jgi:hypothetical protein
MLSMRNQNFGSLLIQLQAPLNVIYEFSPYLKENATLHRYNDQFMNAVYGNNHTKPANTE